jgi:hypothetical protein
MKDVIIGAASGYTWDTLKYWINSIKQSGFKGDTVLILMNCDFETVKKVADAGVKIIGFEQDAQGNLVYQHGKIPVHVERFLHIYEYLRTNEYRFAVTTDVKDVVFQKDPIAFIEATIGDKNMLFSSESMKYKDEAWGNQNLMETYGPYIHDKFKDKEIFNVGVLGGRAYALRDLCINIFTAAINRPIPICDQSTFNFMISQHPYLHTSKYMRSEEAWACQLGTTADPSKIEAFRPFLLEAEPKLVGDKVTTSFGYEFTIVHQYDRVPEWRKLIEAKYG